MVGQAAPICWSRCGWLGSPARMQTLTAIIIALMVIALAVFVGLVWAAKKGLLKGTGHKYTKVRPGLWLLGLSVQSRAGSSQSPKPFSRLSCSRSVAKCPSCSVSGEQVYDDYTGGSFKM